MPRFFFVVFSLRLPSLCAVFRRVLLCRPYVDPPAGHIMGHSVPANSRLAPPGLGLRPQRMFVSFYIFLFFLSFCCSSFFFWLAVCLPCVFFIFFFFRLYMQYHGYVLGIILSQEIRDGIFAQLIVAFSHRDAFCFSLFCDHGKDFRKTG